MIAFFVAKVMSRGLDHFTQKITKILISSVNFGQFTNTRVVLSYGFAKICSKNIMLLFIVDPILTYQGLLNI